MWGMVSTGLLNDLMPLLLLSLQSILLCQLHMFAVSISFTFVPRLMAFGLVPQSSTPDRYLKSPSHRLAALSGALPSGSPPGKLVHCPSGAPYPNHPSVSIASADPSDLSVPPFSKPIRRPSGPPFGKPQHESLAAEVGKLISLDKSIFETSSPQSPHPQSSIPLSVASSSSRQVPSFGKLGSKASASSSPPPSRSDMEPRHASTVRDAISAIPKVR